MLLEYKGKWPKLGERVYIAGGTYVIGDVEIGDHSSIWFNCVLRGDVGEITVGENTNLQDGSIVHVTEGEADTHIGANIVIGHRVVLDRKSTRLNSSH